MNARFEAESRTDVAHPAPEPVRPPLSEAELAAKRAYRPFDPRPAMGVLVEGYGEMSRTLPMRIAVNAAYLVIWGAFAAIWVAILT